MSTNLSADTGPVKKAARIQSIDTLRGVALFGILIMNIIVFALPLGSYYNPAMDANLEGWNLYAYMGMDIFFEGSLRTIFSMLFGAGVILFTSKPDTASISVADLWFRRTTLLILFGVIDAYLLLWVGDILYVYGIAGLFLFMFRNSSPLKLTIYGAIILVALASISTSGHFATAELKSQVDAIQAMPEDAPKTDAQLATLAAYQQVLDENFSLPEQTVYGNELRKGDYLSIVRGLAPFNLSFQTTILYLHNLWDAMAMMLFGMALIKWHCFDASHSYRFYGVMAILGFGIGLPVNYYEVMVFIDSGFSAQWMMNAIRPTYDIGRLGVAFGYIGIVMLICKSGMMTWLRSSLAAVGQMALTNYLSHSIICNTIFMGFGFGLVGELQRYEIYYVVLAIWVFQLVFSPIWLRYFRFGPVEWLWRSMTYMQWQPMRSLSQASSGALADAR